MKPVDEFFRDYLRPTLKAAGFRRNGRRFYFTSESKDLAMIEVRSFPSAPNSVGFWLKAAVYPEPYRAFHGIPDEPDYAQHGFWGQQVQPNSFENPGSTQPLSWWSAPESDTAEMGSHLVAILTDHLVPRLLSMTDRGKLLTAIREGEFRWRVGTGTAFTILAEDGWTPELALELATTRLSGDDHYRRRVVDFAGERIPRSAPPPGGDLVAAIEATRRSLPPLVDEEVTAVTVLDKVVRLTLAGEVFRYLHGNRLHAQLILPDGRTQRCIAAPAETSYEDGPAWNNWVNIEGIPAVDSPIGARLRISWYRSDESLPEA